ncbi:cob(I)yrinic acid a,c-diamide adenosyltransferase, partial [Natrinema soli]
MYARVDRSRMSDDRTQDSAIENTPGQGRTPEPERIEPAAPEEFGLVQVWWGDGKGKTTATLGMGLR